MNDLSEKELSALDGGWIFVRVPIPEYGPLPTPGEGEPPILIW